MTTMTADRIISERRSVLLALDPWMRRELLRFLAAADADGWHIDLTIYDRQFRGSPGIGGHWTAFRAHIGPQRHEVDVLTVAVHFEGATAVDLGVGGMLDIIAGGCTVAALREALAECAGPLRQTTPLAAGTARPDLAELEASLAR